MEMVMVSQYPLALVAEVIAEGTMRVVAVGEAVHFLAVGVAEAVMGRVEFRLRVL
jgi:hypothetical protein